MLPLVLLLQPIGQPLTNEQAIVQLNKVVNEANAKLDKIQSDNQDILNALQRLNSRIAVVEGDVSSISVQVTKLDSRLSALERGSIQPFRSPSTLTDPIAAQAAGRQVGMYDQFGRFMQPVQQTFQYSQQSFPLIRSNMQFSYSLPQYQQSQVMQMVPQYQQYNVGCSNSSCGVRRFTLFPRLAQRRGR